jgi:predicted DsbA family dithiol-disulfide isomerase
MNQMRTIFGHEADVVLNGGEGVPFFLVNGGIILLGAKPPDTFLEAFGKATSGE